MIAFITARIIVATFMKGTELYLSVKSSSTGALIGGNVN